MLTFTLKAPAVTAFFTSARYDFLSLFDLQCPQLFLAGHPLPHQSDCYPGRTRGKKRGNEEPRPFFFCFPPPLVVMDDSRTDSGADKSSCQRVRGPVRVLIDASHTNPGWQCRKRIPLLRASHSARRSRKPRQRPGSPRRTGMKRHCSKKA
jgi:hypothetical protein